MSTVLVVDVSSWNASDSGYGSIRVLYLLSTLQSLGQQTKSLPSIAKGASSASIQACALKLIWQRVSSLLHRDVYLSTVTKRTDGSWT